jgi:hypothetical protein
VAFTVAVKGVYYIEYQAVCAVLSYDLRPPTGSHFARGDPNHTTAQKLWYSLNNTHSVLHLPRPLGRPVMSRLNTTFYRLCACCHHFPRCQGCYRPGDRSRWCQHPCFFPTWPFNAAGTHLLQKPPCWEFPSYRTK